MHDTVDIEARGIPGVFVATVKFAEAAQVQARALGADPAALYVPHPIQDRSDDEVFEIADQAFEGVVGQLVG